MDLLVTLLVILVAIVLVVAILNFVQVSRPFGLSPRRRRREPENPFVAPPSGRGDVASACLPAAAASTAEAAPAEPAAAEAAEPEVPPRGRRHRRDRAGGRRREAVHGLS